MQNFLALPGGRVSSVSRYASGNVMSRYYHNVIWNVQCFFPDCNKRHSHYVLYHRLFANAIASSMYFVLAFLITRRECVAQSSCILYVKMLLQYNFICEDYGLDCVETLNCTISFRRNFQSKIGINRLRRYSVGFF